MSEQSNIYGHPLNLSVQRTKTQPNIAFEADAQTQRAAQLKR